MSPQTLTLPEFELHIGRFLAEKSTFWELHSLGLNRFAVVLRKVCLPLMSATLFGLLYIVARFLR